MENDSEGVILTPNTVFTQFMPCNMILPLFFINLLKGYYLGHSI